MGPTHIAIIPDGNRRWAKKHGQPIIKAYERGIDNIGNVLTWCRKYKVKKLTMWGFSTENFRRDEKEIRGLFGLFSKKLSVGLKEDYMKYGVRVRFLGRISEFPREVQEKMRQVERDTEGNRKYELNLLLAYGGRQEIMDAVNKAIEGKRKLKAEDEFAALLYLSESPDLVIRTSGQYRTSGLMPWQTAYSEYYFSKKLWQDFNESEFRRAIQEYSKRKRNYGK